MTRRRAAPTSLLVAVLVVVLGACAGGRTGSGGPAVSDRLPDASLASFDGGAPLDLSTLKGPAVVNLWASWCGPCRRELPLYQAFSKAYAGRVDVVGIDFQDTQVSRARDLIARTGVTYPLYSDRDGLMRAQVLPKVVLVDAEGRIAYQKYVEITSQEQLAKLVATHLGVQAP